MASGYPALYLRVILLLFLVSLVSGDCIDLDLGIGSGNILDNSITASSEISDAKNGRLNEIKAWCASTGDGNPYLQIDLETIHIVCAVSTQGNPNADQWIETYTIQVSEDGTTWTDYKEHGQNKTFTGNNDRNTENKNILPEGVLAKTLRFIGQTSYDRFCLRTEIYGVKVKPENLALGKPTGQRRTYRSGTSGKAVDGNVGTNFDPGERCAHTLEDNPSWWWVNLGSDNVPISEVLIVNRFSPSDGIRQRNKDYVLTLGNSDSVVNNPTCIGEYTFIEFIASAVCHRNPLTTGRYLGIKTTKRQFLQLCEVEVYSRENLAYRKDTIQSSTVSGAVSSRAVDGNSNTVFNAGSCAHTNDEKQPWWRVDLGNVELVNEVYVVNRGDCCGDRLNPFEIRVGVNSSNGGITNPKCGDGYSVSQNQGASFFCRPSLYGRYVTIRRHDDRTTALNFCEVEVYSARRACQIQAIGLASSDTIPDNSFSAWTHRSGNEASKGRLNGNGAWSPSRNDDDNDYLQIDLEDQFFVCAVATQGSSSHDHWTTKYKLRYWLENSTWLTYQEDGIEKIFNANDGRNDIVKHSLVGIIRARFIRFQPREFKTEKALRVEVYGILTTAAPSRAPTNFTVTPSSSTSVQASWQLPTADFQIITGFRLLYRNFSSVEDPLTVITIESNSTLSYEVTGLGIFTKYEFQVLSFSIVGDGPSSAVKTVRTNAEAPSQAPNNLNVTINNSTSVSVNWQLPPGISKNGVILGFTLYYRKKGASGQANTATVPDGTVLSTTITGLGKFTEYDFQMSAFTYAGDGPISSVVTEKTSEDAPSFGPDNLVTTELNETTFNISWAPLPTEKSNGLVVLYEANVELVSTRGGRARRAVASSKGVNTTNTFAVLYDFLTCSQYSFSVRAFTTVGPGPYGPATQLQTRHERSLLKAIMTEETKVTLEWTPPTNVPVEGLKYKVKYTGKKYYNSSFLDIGEQDADSATKYLVGNLVPGTRYNFEVISTSVCGESLPSAVDITTQISAPLAPNVGEITVISASKSSADIQLWPAEQRNGPISTYQVIVLKVADGNENLPPDYDFKLRDSEEASQSNVDFYISAELSNDPVYETAWKFTVGDEKKYGLYKNTVLQKGEEYIVFQRALTDDKIERVVLKGNHIKVAKVSVTKDVGNNDAAKGSNGTDIVPIVVPVVLLFLLIPAVVIALIFYRRRKRSQKGGDSKTPIQLDSVGSDIGLDSTVYQTVAAVNSHTKSDDKLYSNVVVDSPKTKSDEQIYQNTKDGSAGRAAKPVYQNITGMRNGKDTAQTAKIKEDELVYSEAQDGKPKPVPASEFVAYFKSKAINGAAVLRKEFKELPGGMLSTWDVAANNKSKNRYGNIVTYDHSRVILEEDSDSKNDYINASYIPTYDEKTMSYIATQGPNKVTVNDFWRMIWQENCLSIVMLTNTVEQGKTKCEKYWPEKTSKYGSVTVSLRKTETFADYIIRTLTLFKGSEKREVLQYHYTTWPDRGVPNHAAALLAFRWKVHVRHQMTGGPIVVHCSAGVGRTGTFIGIDAMLESAKKQNRLFIYNYVQVMRRQRPHMIQKDEQYVFLHQSVMVALVCGNTEVSSHDLQIRMNKLARVNKTSKQTGYAEELKIIGEFEGSEEESKVALQPANINKNRFPDILPLDSGRLILKSSEPGKDYINASFVDDYTRRDAYILTQAPLDNTINDFWRMVSQYDIGTVVMLNSLEGGKEVYPQYWPSKGSTRYGNITLEMLSESTANGITTRKISIANTEPPKKHSTVQHLQFTGWSDPNSCPDPQEILGLLTAVQKSQQQTGNGTIVFQCSDGVGRSGVAATVMSAIEKLKNEQTVDVLQTVHLIRVKRPFAVLNVEQYMLCYKTIHAYLDSFGEYANFSK